MNIFSIFNRRASAPVARERLQVLLAHERASIGQTDLVAVLREEILAVIAKHVSVEPDNLRIRMERGDQMSTLEVEVDIPKAARVRLALTG
ncbi:cell division topological specificity factor MinE [uncultured Alsobacter sp.]|uniref:cell division topological specificity factor MinE n=1 Tax=uncultured Alsobacter sp. TaxID=1748258 RepID=UPI0025E96201|nr:cell division topological specificity factor MinE [uncultured Alsobacter sp.]